MRLWLVDHGYGAALIYAATKAQAEDMGDALGPVSRVVPFNIPLAFTIERTPEMDGDSPSGISARLAIEATGEWEYENDVSALLEKHEIALDAAEEDEFEDARVARGLPPTPTPRSPCLGSCGGMALEGKEMCGAASCGPEPEPRPLPLLWSGVDVGVVGAHGIRIGVTRDCTGMGAVEPTVEVLWSDTHTLEDAPLGSLRRIVGRGVPTLGPLIVAPQDGRTQSS